MAIQFKLNPVVLKSVPLFSAFTEQQLVTLLNYVQHRSYPRNVFVIQAGDETDSLYVILAGKVKVLIPDDQGREVILSVMGPHDFLARWASLMISRARPACRRWSRARCCVCRKRASSIA